MTGEKSIVFITQSFPPEKGGNASRISDTAHHLSAKGWSVTILTPPPTIPAGRYPRVWQRKRQENSGGVTVHRLWTWQPQVEDPGLLKRLPYYLLFGIHAMWWLVWNMREYELVFVSSPPISTGAPGILASLLGKSVTVDIRDLWIEVAVALGYLQQDSVIARISRKFQSLMLRRADRITVTTQTLADHLLQRYGTDLSEKIRIIPNGVDTELFDCHTSLSAPNKELTRLKTTPIQTDGAGPPIIVYTGNFGSAQALENVVEAMEYLSHDTARLQLVGSGDRESRLKSLVSARDLSHRVDFFEPVSREKIPEILCTATIGIAPLKKNPELSYAVPTKLFEYHACGLPTIVSGSGEIRRFIEESGGGMHTSLDPPEIAHVIDELLIDEVSRRKMSQAGHRFVNTRYDRSVIADTLDHELQELVQTDG